MLGVVNTITKMDGVKSRYPISFMTQIRKSLWFLLLVVGWTACSKTGENPTQESEETLPNTGATVGAGFKTYTILAGAHYATENPIEKVTGDSIAFTVRFDSTCRYQTKNPRNQDDINKLMGFSDNGVLHHQNSARVGWRWKKEKIELFAYCYAEGTRSFVKLGEVAIGDTARMLIKLSSVGYEFQYKGVSTIMSRGLTGSTTNGYLLYPYFGGDEPAPHTMKLWIKR
jgi:hypothetical protein